MNKKPALPAFCFSPWGRRLTGGHLVDHGFGRATAVGLRVGAGMAGSPELQIDEMSAEDGIIRDRLNVFGHAEHAPTSADVGLAGSVGREPRSRRLSSAHHREFGSTYVATTSVA